MKTNIDLMDEQALFMTSTKPIITYIGGIGAGKSFIACIKAVKNALNGRNQMMVGLTFSHARDVLLTTLMKVLELYNLTPDHYTLNKSQLEIGILGRATIYIKSAELGEKLRGYTVSDIFIDEAAYHKDKSIFDILLGRMREVEDGQMHLTTSPRSFNWCYELIKNDDVEYISVSTFRNPFLPKRYIENMMKQYSSSFIRQELYAEFISLSTGIFNSKWIKLLSSNQDLYDKYTNGRGRKIRFWDFAFSDDNKSDYSAGVLMSKIGNYYIIEDIVRVRQTYTTLKETIVNTAIKDGKDVEIGFEKVGTQKAVVDDLVRDRRLAGYVRTAFSVAQHGSKIKRILPLASSAENGMIYIADSCNNKNSFLSECDSLTIDDSHQNDDMVDASASAYLMFQNLTVTTGHKTNLY
jgi:PBSX family phage terminase large subunit